MAYIEIEEARPLTRSYPQPVLSKCPDCDGDLAVLRVIGGRAGCEYWALRCTDCGSIHLDILEPQTPAEDNDGPRPAA
jgi:hypothetical protein